MNEFAKPIIRTWNYVEEVGGFPGQCFFCVMVIMLVIGGLTWYGNRR